MKKLVRDKSTSENKAYWEKIEATQALRKKEAEAGVILREAGVHGTWLDFLDILSDDKRLQEVRSRLKLRAFW